MGCDKKEDVLIVFACSSTYIVQTYTAAYSLIKNCAEPLKLCFLIRDDCSLQAERLLCALGNEKAACSVLRIGFERFQGAYIGGQHVLLTTYYRLMIPELFPETEKCLYLDSDIIADKDISGLMHWDMKENVVGGVLAAGYQDIRHNGEEYCRKIGLPEISHYINAGVLLLKPKEIRSDGTYDTWMKLSQKKYPVLDQDIINISCYGRIELLPPIYNSMVTHQYYRPEDLERVFGKEEAVRARKEPCIIHYSGKEKPWNGMETPFCGIWWKYYEDAVRNGCTRDDIHSLAPEIEAEYANWLNNKHA